MFMWCLFFGEGQVFIFFSGRFSVQWRVTISEDDDDDSLFSRCYKLRTMVVTTTQRIKSSARSKKTSSTSCSGRINQETTKIFKIQGRCHWGHEFQEFWRRCEHCVIVRLRIPFLRRHFSTKKFFLIFFPHRTSVWVFMGVFFFSIASRWFYAVGFEAFPGVRLSRTQNTPRSTVGHVLLLRPAVLHVHDDIDAEFFFFDARRQGNDRVLR